MLFRSEHLIKNGVGKLTKISVFPASAINDDRSLSNLMAVQLSLTFQGNQVHSEYGIALTQDDIRILDTYMPNVFGDQLILGELVKVDKEIDLAQNLDTFPAKFLEQHNG